MTSFINQIVGDRYYIQSLLGRQIGRRTFLATDLQTQATVVLKLLLFDPEFTWDAFKLFEREAKTLTALNHPAIPTYVDSLAVETSLGKGFALVQSHIEARSLQDWVESGRHFSEEDLKAIALSLLEIFDYLHRRQPPVIHRDIKPSNILLGDRSGNSLGQIYLVDFGSVQTVQQSGTITIVGTYGYMPPEQFAGRTQPASDLYSLGATLVYLLTGTHPADLPSRNGRLQFEQHCTLSEPFKVWLKYMIQPDIERRFSTAQAAIDALQQDSLAAYPPYQNLRGQPKGSRVKLTKTDEQLQIKIADIPVKSKLKTVYANLITTGFLCLPYLLFLWHPSLGWLMAPVLSWFILSIWARACYSMFETLSLSIDPEKIRLTRGWLGYKRSHSSPTQDIIKIDRLVRKYTVGVNNFHYSSLSLWAGNYPYVIERADVAENLRRLTEVELDWLANELSEWLELPVQRFEKASTEVVNINHDGQIITDEVPEASPEVDDPINSPNAAIDSLVTPLKIHPIERPKNAVCQVTKSFKYPDKCLEISTPVGRNNSWLTCGCMSLIFGLMFGFPLLLAVTANVPLIGLLLGTVPLLCLWLDKRANNDSQTARVVLYITQDKIALSREPSSYGKSFFNSAPLKQINKLMVVYSSSSTNQRQRLYHIELTSAGEASTHGLAKPFLVGDRRYWLSRREAYWLAYELSTWLNLPVTEREVIFQETA